MKQSADKKIFHVSVFVLIVCSFLLGALAGLPTIQSYRIITQMRMDTWAEMAGDFQARDLFRTGNCRLLELYPISKFDTGHISSTFTGKKEGPFEIWTRPAYINTKSVLGWLAKDAGDEKYVESFNRSMKQLWDEKQTSQKTNLVSKGISH
jgi:hypothetical protein